MIVLFVGAVSMLGLTAAIVKAPEQEEKQTVPIVALPPVADEEPVVVLLVVSLGPPRSEDPIPFAELVVRDRDVRSVLAEVEGLEDPTLHAFTSINLKEKGARSLRARDGLHGRAKLAFA